MRALLLSGLLALLAVPVHGQPKTKFDSSAVTAVEYTVLDEMTFDDASLFSGESGEVSFTLSKIKNLDSGQVLTGAEVTVAKSKQRRVGGSLALAAIGSLFGTSSSVTYRRIRESGFVFLRGADLEEVVSFLNDVVGALGRQQEHI